MTANVGSNFVDLPDDRIRTMAASASFWAWCALLSFPMIGTTQDLVEIVHVYGSSGTVFLCQIAGLALFLLIMGLTHFGRIIPTISRLGPPQIAILVIIYLSLLLQLHDGEAATLMGIGYTCLLLVTALMLSVLWTLTPADLARCMSVASAILCMFGISAIAILGLPVGRSVGDIHPNLFATPLLTAFILSQFRAGIIGVAVRILCLSMVALVSSRFALIGCASALVAFELTFKALSPRTLSLLIVALIAGLAFGPQIASILALDDPTRDLSSGISGRDAYWDAAIAAIVNDPFGIGFKRTLVEESGHNGYLKMLVEFGIVGGGLIIFSIGCVVVMAGIDAVRSSGKTLQEHRSACARFGGLAAWSFGAFFQPQLFNFGDAIGVTFLFLLFAPKINPIFGRIPNMGTARSRLFRTSPLS
jgi:hypothetical protein